MNNETEFVMNELETFTQMKKMGITLADLKEEYRNRFNSELFTEACISEIFTLMINEQVCVADTEAECQNIIIGEG